MATPLPAPGECPGAGNAELAGTITVLTNRTDIVDTVFVEYAERFNELYPNVKVEFEALRDYSGEVQIRMSTTDYGDVLLIPDSVPLEQLSTFFEPLGSVAELDQTYNFVNEKAYGGQVYGIAKTGNVQGVACNQKVLDAAGVTSYPKTPDEFIAAMQLVKDKTDAIPVYTNYAADIVYMPFPSSSDGKQYAAAGGDWKVGVNKNSENKAAALAWLWWFLDESNFAYDQGGVPPLEGKSLPPQLGAFQTAGVTLVTSNPAPAGEDGLRDKIDNEAEIGLFADAWKQRIVDAARGASGESFEEITSDLNTRWAAARAGLGVTQEPSFLEVRGTDGTSASARRNRIAP